MSPRGQKKDAEVEVVDDTEVEVTPEQVQEAEDFLSEPVNQEEFNEFIVNLARNAAQQEIAGLEKRIRDLELLVASPVEFTPIHEVPAVPTQYEDDGIPDYSRAHQSGDGTPWYTG